MSKWPVTQALINQVRTIDVVGPYGCLPAGTVAPTSAIWPTANKILYLPFTVPTVLIADKLRVNNGAAVSGNLDAGIYTKEGIQLVNTGSTAQAGTSTYQVIDITDTELWVDTFYFALTFDNITATTLRTTFNLAPVAGMAGILMEAAGSFGLPATATFAEPADAYAPAMGLLALGVTG